MGCAWCGRAVAGGSGTLRSCAAPAALLLGSGRRRRHRPLVAAPAPPADGGTRDRVGHSRELHAEGCLPVFVWLLCLGIMVALAREAAGCWEAAFELFFLAAMLVATHLHCSLRLCLTSCASSLFHFLLLCPPCRQAAGAGPAGAGADQPHARLGPRAPRICGWVASPQAPARGLLGLDGRQSAAPAGGRTGQAGQGQGRRQGKRVQLRCAAALPWRDRCCLFGKPSLPACLSPLSRPQASCASRCAWCCCATAPPPTSQL